MHEPTSVLAILALGLGLVCLLAWLADRLAARGRDLSDNGGVYALTLMVYCTGWSFFGTVGSAASQGPLFAAVFLGPSVGAVVAWQVVRRLVRIKREHHVTSVAEFLSARYGKSQAVAAMAALVLIFGTTPYVALQLKSLSESFAALARGGGPASQFIQDALEPLMAGLLILFAILLGMRRADPTQRHPGMAVAVALLSAFKIAAMLAVGGYVAFGLFDGYADIMNQASRLRLFAALGQPGGPPHSLWTSVFLLSMLSALLLPWQFHAAVVENARERHILTAMWLFPLGLLLLNLFVPVLAMGGLLTGLGRNQADLFVIALPLSAGQPGLALLGFLGGAAASAGMVMLACATMSVMIVNHLALPLGRVWPALNVSRRRILPSRWVAAGLYILAGYGFRLLVGDALMLADIGLISFAAVAQLAPAALAGLFWVRANRAGALWGMGLGFAVWGYTLVLPSLARAGHLPASLLTQGPLDLAWLAPERLLGLTALDPLSHGLFWSLLTNAGVLALCSHFLPQSSGERAVAKDFLALMSGEGAARADDQAEADIPLRRKRKKLEAVLRWYLSREEALQIMTACVQESGLGGREFISVLDLAGLRSRVEKRLAGIIGSASASRALQDAGVFSLHETRALTRAYGGLLTELRITPEELRQGMDYYREREKLMAAHATELEGRISERDREINKRKRIESALRQARRKYRDIVENAMEGIYQCALDGTVKDANPAFLSILGYPYLRTFQTEAGSFRDALEDPGAWDALLMRLEGPGTVREFETVMRRKDGEARWVRMNARLVVPKGGGAMSVEGSLQDVTERKRTREEIVRLNAELEQRVLERTAELAAANRELEAFSYSVSHDLRQPLRSIDGFGQILEEDYQEVLDAEGQDCLDRIRRSTQRMGDLIDDILRLGQVTRAEIVRERVDLSAMARDILAERAERDPDRRVDIQVQDGLTAQADPRLVRVLMDNLLGNAWKFTGKTPGARVEFAAEPETDDPAGTGTRKGSRTGPTVFLVRDNGAGFDMAYADKLFGAFNRLHGRDEFEGTGVGLAIVQRVARRHGGDVRAEAEIGRGAVFRFTLEG